MTLLVVLYAVPLGVATLNLLLMLRPSGRAPMAFEVMIPARDEEANLLRLIPLLRDQGITVTVFDDESRDRTAQVASEHGARVIPAIGPLPDGWTGKNRACNELSRVARRPWVVFLDADVDPSPEFGPALSAFLTGQDAKTGVVTGFPAMRPGQGLEPAYLGWVPWILLATNPFGLVSRVGFGHNGFTNGQFSAWRLETLREIQPYASVRSAVLEDVKIGRLLARKKVRVTVLDLSRVLAVRMYDDLPGAFAGMTKNSVEIAGPGIGSILLSLVFLVLGWAWLFAGDLAWILYAMLVGSKLAADRIVRMPLWTAPLMPLTLTAAAATVLWSWVLHLRGKREWKGRLYR